MRRIFTLLILGFLFASGAGAQSYKFDFTFRNFGRFL